MVAISNNYYLLLNKARKRATHRACALNIKEKTVKSQKTKPVKQLAFVALVALAVTLLFQIPTVLAQGKKVGNHNQQINSPFVTVAAGIY
jgi:hypothetical protein